MIAYDPLISVLSHMAPSSTLASHEHRAVTPYILTPSTPPSLCPFPLFLAIYPSLSLSLSFVYLLMCEIILGWRDGFLPEGLSGGVSLLFNNRLGVYVYLSMVIDYRLVLDNKPHSGGQTDSGVKRLSNFFKSRQWQTFECGLGTPSYENISLPLWGILTS